MIVLYGIVIIFAYVIQTIFGFAGTAIITPLLFLIVGADTTVAVTGMLGAIGCGTAVIKVRKNILFQEVWKIIPLMIAGIIIGFYLRTVVTMGYLVKLYGIFIMGVSCVMFITNGRIRLSRNVNCLLLLCAGVIHGLFVCGGPLLVLYAMQAIPQKEHFRATINFIWMILNAILVIGHFREGLYTGSFFYYEGIAIIMAGMGIYAGEIINKRIMQKGFMKAGSVLLFVTGLLLLK